MYVKNTHTCIHILSTISRAYTVYENFTTVEIPTYKGDVNFLVHQFFVKKKIEN